MQSCCVLLSSASGWLDLGPGDVFSHTYLKEPEAFSLFLQRGGIFSFCAKPLTILRLNFLMWPNTLNSMKGFGVQNAVLCYAERCKRAAISVYTCMRKRGSRLLKARVVPSWYSIPFLWLYCWGVLCLSKVLCMPSPCVHCGLQCIENYTCSSPLAVIPFRIRNDCNCFLRASPISPEHLVFNCPTRSCQCLCFAFICL